MTLLLCAVTLSEGCSCAVPTIPPSVDWTGDDFEYWNKQRFCDADFAIKAKVLKRSKPRISDDDDPWSVGPASYTVKVLNTFKGSFNENEIIQLKTPALESLCGVHLNVKRKYGKTKYILTGRRSNGQLEIMLCDWFEPWSKNTLKQIRKISSKC